MGHARAWGASRCCGAQRCGCARCIAAHQCNATVAHYATQLALAALCRALPPIRPRAPLLRARPPARPPRTRQSAERKRRMLQYVRDVEPAAVLEEFLIKESPIVIGAMRQTISNMLGTITATPQVGRMLVTLVNQPASWSLGAAAAAPPVPWG